MAVVSPLHNENGRCLLDTIDRLKLLPSISHELALPQLVVVGQQSSGKSSVLKAISNIDFPTNEGLCTHFATEIVCRREAHETMRAQIIPVAAVDDQYQRRLEAFTARWSQIPRDQNISEIIQDATRVMGLDSHRQISKDKLRLEFSGPQQDHISLIDLPGLFEQTKPDQRKEDLAAVDEMVKQYIKSSQTIILAVVSGRCDVTIQRIFGIFEPHSERTLGIVTAPDLVENGTVKATDFSQLVANTSFKAGHGWHVLRNLSHGEEQRNLDRDEIESKFFTEQSSAKGSFWAKVPSERLGIQNLKSKLAKLLQISISEGLPQVQQQLRTAQRLCEQELKLLGLERETVDQQREYLAKKSRSLHEITRDELSGESSGPSLRSQIRNANDDFAESMDKFGATYNFDTNETDVAMNVSPSGVVAPTPISGSEWVTKVLEDVINNRGQEMDGLVNPVWVGRMFRKQSRKWETLAEYHTDEAFAIVKQYFADVIERIVGVENAERFLTNVIEPELQKRKDALNMKVQELLTPYSTNYPRTLNRRFRSQETDLSSLLMEGTGKQALTQNMVTHYTSSMVEYYGIALDTFVDNFVSLAIENVLLNGLENMLTESKAWTMPEAELVRLTAESEEVVERRQVLRARMRDYEKASQIMSRYSAQRYRPTYDEGRITSGYHTTNTAATMTPQRRVGAPPAEAPSHSPDQNNSVSSTPRTVTEAVTPEQPDRAVNINGSSPGSNTTPQILTEEGLVRPADVSPDWSKHDTGTNLNKQFTHMRRSRKGASSLSRSGSTDPENVFN